MEPDSEADQLSILRENPLDSLFKLPLLTSEECRELSKRILKSKVKTKIKVRGKPKFVVKDREAVNTFVRHNLKLVKSIAKNFLGQSNLELDDLVQEGIPGLIRAAELYDYRKGNAFSTYATWWIRQTIQRAIEDKGETIRVPAYAHQQRRKIWKFLKKFQDKHGREPTENEIVEFLASASKSSRGVLKDILVVMRTTPNFNSLLHLDSAVGEDLGGSDLGDAIPDCSELGPEKLAEAKDELKSALKRIEDMKPHLLRGAFSERNQEIFFARFGLENGSFERKTLEEVAKVHKVSRERVRQVVDEGIKKLRSFGIKVWHQFENEIAKIKYLRNLIASSEV